MVFLAVLFLPVEPPEALLLVLARAAPFFAGVERLLADAVTVFLALEALALELFAADDFEVELFAVPFFAVDFLVAEDFAAADLAVEDLPAVPFLAVELLAAELFAADDFAAEDFAVAFVAGAFAVLVGIEPSLLCVGEALLGEALLGGSLVSEAPDVPNGRRSWALGRKCRVSGRSRTTLAVADLDPSAALPGVVRSTCPRMSSGASTDISPDLASALFTSAWTRATRLALFERAAATSSSASAGTWPANAAGPLEKGSERRPVTASMALARVVSASPEASWTYPRSDSKATERPLP